MKRCFLKYTVYGELHISFSRHLLFGDVPKVSNSYIHSVSLFSCWSWIGSHWNCINTFMIQTHFFTKIIMQICNASLYFWTTNITYFVKHTNMHNILAPNNDKWTWTNEEHRSDQGQQGVISLFSASVHSHQLVINWPHWSYSTKP